MKIKRLLGEHGKRLKSDHIEIEMYIIIIKTTSKVWLKSDHIEIEMHQII